MTRGLLFLFTAALFAAPPTITELRPRGAERSRPFTLTVIGRDIPDGTRIWSTMPASFTRVVSSSPDDMMLLPPGRSAQFLVEPKPDIAPGVYPIRLDTPSGISNVVLFSIGTFPELTEQESLPYSRPHRNDTVENAEAIQTNPVIVNGTLRGAEKDLYRVYGKGTETRVFEVEARRSGSAVDPVLRILDGSGKQLAKSDDGVGAGLDPRLQFTFPREGYYYVEVHDARFSNQSQGFYRLKMGGYQFAEGVFPLGGQRGKPTPVTFEGGNLPVPVKAAVDLSTVPANQRLTKVAPANSPSLPFLFAVSEHPEFIEPSTATPVPGVINGKLAAAGEVDRYKIQVQPGDKLLFEVQARELGTSRLEAILTAYDPDGKKLDSAGDKPLPEDVFVVERSNRTSSDPFLNLTVPDGVQEITLAIEDLARRGGAHYGYRIVMTRQAEDFTLSLASPHVNVPAGGAAIVVATAERRGYDGPIELSIPDLPQGIRVEGGMIPREYVDAKKNRTFNRRGVLILSAEPGFEMPLRDLVVHGAGKLDDGTVIQRRARGIAMAVDVAGATAQGVVDRQRPVTAPWLGFDLPAASTTPPSATLEVKQVKVTRMEEGDRYDFAYTWNVRAKDVQLPNDLNVDVVGARDTRITAFEKSGDSGTFAINITKSTDPARYDIIVRGRLRVEGGNEDVYARPIPLVVTERSTNAQTAATQ